MAAVPAAEGDDGEDAIFADIMADVLPADLSLPPLTSLMHPQQQSHEPQQQVVQPQAPVMDPLTPGTPPPQPVQHTHAQEHEQAHACKEQHCEHPLNGEQSCEQGRVHPKEKCASKGVVRGDGEEKEWVEGVEAVGVHDVYAGGSGSVVERAQWKSEQQGRHTRASDKATDVAALQV